MIAAALEILGSLDSFENLMKAFDALFTVGEAGMNLNKKLCVIDRIFSNLMFLYPLIFFFFSFLKEVLFDKKGKKDSFSRIRHQSFPVRGSISSINVEGRKFTLKSRKPLFRGSQKKQNKGKQRRSPSLVKEEGRTQLYRVCPMPHGGSTDYTMSRGTA